MKIRGKVHCLFEHSGLFKNEFKKLGYDAYDYGEEEDEPGADYTVDLFKEIDKAYNGNKSIFDNMTHDDLIMVFYPSGYFEQYFGGGYPFYKEALFGAGSVDLTLKERYDNIIDCARIREFLYATIYKLYYVCKMNSLHLILNNSGERGNYLLNVGNFYPCTLIDRLRMSRWNYYWNPSAYWFYRCKPVKVKSQNRTEAYVEKMLMNDVYKGKKAEWCSLTEEDYASDFIRELIIGESDTK